MVGNHTTAKNIKKGDRLEIGGYMTGIITDVEHVNSLVKLFINKAMIATLDENDTVLVFFAEQNKHSFFFHKR